MNKQLVKTLKLGQDVKLNNTLYRVFEVNSKEITLIPVMNKLVNAMLMTIPDRSRKPLVINKELSK